MQSQGLLPSSYRTKDTTMVPFWFQCGPIWCSESHNICYDLSFLVRKMHQQTIATSVYSKLVVGVTNNEIFDGKLFAKLSAAKLVRRATWMLAFARRHGEVGEMGKELLYAKPNHLLPSPIDRGSKTAQFSYTYHWSFYSHPLSVLYSPGVNYTPVLYYYTNRCTRRRMAGFRTTGGAVH